MKFFYNILLIGMYVNIKPCLSYNDESNLHIKLKQIENYGVFYTLNETLETYRHYYHYPVVKVMLKELSERYPEIGLVENPRKSHPFIAVEGVHRKTRAIAAQFLARKMGADIIYNPPKFMIRLGLNFSDQPLRKAFFGVGGYATACSARELTKTVPVVVAGHWMSQAAFAIAKVYDKIPSPNSPVYSWPEDMYMPDMVFFINNSPRRKKTEEKNSDFLPKFVDVFRNWRSPPVFEIGDTYLYEEIAAKMLEIVNKELDGNY